MALPELALRTAAPAAYRPAPPMPHTLASLPPAVRQALLARYREHLHESGTRLGRQGELGWPDLKAGAAEAHRLAGAAGLMQDPHLSDAARALERLLRGEDREGASRQLQRLEGLLGSAIAQLGEAGAADGAGHPPGGSPRR